MKKRKSPVEGLQCPSCGDGIGSVWQTTGKVCEGGHGQGSPARAFNFVFAGLIGGCVLVWRLLVAAWYVPLTLYRLLTASCACVITED